jgi:hypothetical protein
MDKEEMTPRIIGCVNWAKQQHDTPDLWRLEEPYAKVTGDGFLVMCPLMVGIDGASYPRLLWSIPGLGHPFEKKNKHWSPFHDFGYRNLAIVIDLKKPGAWVQTPESWAAMWDRIPAAMRIPPHSLGRTWWDCSMVETMKLCGEHPVKQFVVYRGVRLGGSRAWNRSA